MPTDVGYTGQRLDATGLMFYHARYYSAIIGRFTSADTLVPGASNPQDLNRYAYGLNNPVKYADPTGHCSQDKDRDSDCWDLYYKAIAKLGYAPVGLDGWSTNQLGSLFSWMQIGIVFATRQDGGGPWTAGNLSDVTTALNLVSQKLGETMRAALGLLNDQRLIIVKDM